MKTRRLGGLSAIALLALTGVAACSQPRTVPALGPGGTLQLGRLEYVSKNGRTLQTAVVNVKIRGQNARMIVDTGASDTVLARAFVERCGLKPLGQFENGSDHAKGTLRAEKLERFSIEFSNPPKVDAEGTVGPSTWRESFSTLPSSGFVFDAPPVFETLGIVGILSPQRLLEKGTAVLLDYQNGVLAIVSQPERFAEAEALTPLGAIWDRQKPFVPSALDGSESVLGELDTGGSHTEADATYLRGGAPNECGGIAISGACIESSEVRGRSVRFAGTTFPMPIMSVKDLKHSDLGDREKMLIGADLLNHCTLLVGAIGEEVYARCKAP